MFLFKIKGANLYNLDHFFSKAFMFGPPYQGRT